MNCGTWVVMTKYTFVDDTKYVVFIVVGTFLGYTEVRTNYLGK